ncbi:MAG: mycofactocin precursor MftA [Streptosporangiaceae bacterium]
MTSDSTQLTDTSAPKAGVGEAGVEDELLVEEVSIDGMCGVY